MIYLFIFWLIDDYGWLMLMILVEVVIFIEVLGDYVLFVFGDLFCNLEMVDVVVILFEFYQVF